MRISTSQIYHQGVNAMLESQTKLANTQQQLATGKRLITPSDDPGAATRILELDQFIDANNQYQRNADFADMRLGLEETVLSGVGDILQRVRELAVRGLNGTMSAGDREAIEAEVRQHMDGLVQLSNSQDANGEYLFGGYQTDTPPFSHDGAGNFAYAGDQGQRMIQIASSRKVAAGDPGDQVFLKVDDGAGGVNSLFNVVYDFAVDLAANNPSGSTLTRLDSAIDEVLTVRSSIGSRQNAIESQRGMNDSFTLLMEQNRSELKDLDYADAISRFEQQMLALQASQQTFTKIEGLSLFNYL